MGGVGGIEEQLAEQSEKNEPYNLEQQFEWKQLDNGTVVIFGDVKGKDFDGLNEMFFEGKAEVTEEAVDGQRQIKIRRTYSSNQIGSREIKITGGDIVHSNADQVEGNTAIWHNPDHLEVTLTEASKNSFLGWTIGGLVTAGLCLGVLVVIAVGIAFFWYRRKQKT
jgi:hypothetical protein